MQFCSKYWVRLVLGLVMVVGLLFTAPAPAQATHLLAQTSPTATKPPGSAKDLLGADGKPLSKGNAKPTAPTLDAGKLKETGDSLKVTGPKNKPGDRLQVKIELPPKRTSKDSKPTQPSDKGR